MAELNKFHWRVYETPDGPTPEVRERFFKGMMEALEDWTQRADAKLGRRRDWQVKVFDSLEGDIYKLHFLIPVHEDINLDEVVWKDPLAVASLKEKIVIELKNTPGAPSAPLILR